MAWTSSTCSPCPPCLLPWYTALPSYWPGYPALLSLHTYYILKLPCPPCPPCSSFPQCLLPWLAYPCCPLPSNYPAYPTLPTLTLTTLPGPPFLLLWLPYWPSGLVHCPTHSRIPDEGRAPGAAGRAPPTSRSQRRHGPAASPAPRAPRSTAAGFGG